MNGKNIAMTYGLVTGLIMVVIGAILHVTGLSMNKALGFASYVPFIAGIIMCCIAYSKANDGYVTFGQVFVQGLIASCVIAGVITIWTFISLAVWPDMIDKLMEQSRAEMQKNPKLTEEQIDMAVSMAGRFMKPMMFVGATIGTVFSGCIFSLIGAGAAKKNGSRPETLDKQTYQY